MVEQDLSGFRMESSRDMSAAAAAAAPATASSPVRTSAPSPLGGSAATSPRSSVQPSAVVSAEPSLVATTAAATEAGRASSSGAEVESLRKEVEARDARLATLQQELEAAQRQLVGSSSSDAADALAAVELQQQNAALQGEVAQLRSQLAAATAAAAAAATTAAARAGGSSDEAGALQEQLGASQARVADLEQQLAAGSSGAASSEAAAAAKLAMAEQKIEQLMVLVQQQGASGGRWVGQQKGVDCCLEGHARASDACHLLQLGPSWGRASLEIQALLTVRPPSYLQRPRG